MSKINLEIDGTLQDKNFVKYLTYTSGLCHWYEEGDKEFRGPSGEHTYLKGMPDEVGGDVNTIRTYDEDFKIIICAKSVKEYCDTFAELGGDDINYDWYLMWVEDWKDI